jgi:glycosyltransferase involved in cell wall biosynthesis
MAHHVIIGIQEWRLDSISKFAEQLVRGLQRNGHNCQILMTEPRQDKSIESRRNSIFPTDFSCVQLPIHSDDTWAQRWESLERYLEERAPCIYLMLHDWRYNVVVSRLSSRIRLIGVIQNGSMFEIDQAKQFGYYWDSIITTSDVLHFKLLVELPHFAAKIHTVDCTLPELYWPPAKAQEGPLQLICVDKLTHNQERLEKVLAIATGLINQGTSYQLTICVNKNNITAIRHKCNDFISKGVISIEEAIDDSAKPNTLEMQHIYLSVSEEDEIPMSILEAMGLGCVPLIAEISSRFPLVIPGKNALLANKGDVNKYVNQIGLLSNNRTLLSQLSTEAVRSIQYSEERDVNMITSCLKLFEKAELVSAKRRKPRQRFHISPPSQTGGENPDKPGPYDMDAAEVSRSAMWPNPPLHGLSKKEVKNTSPLPPLSSYKIFVSASPQYISGVDVFAIHLVRGLLKKGLNACILTSGGIRTDKSLLDLTDLPIEVIDYPEYLGWQERWQILINKLSSSGPAIYIPNYDYANSCIISQLPANVRVIGISHSDDPMHYEHLCRIGHSCDAIVGVSTAITQHLSKLAPHFAKGLTTIPYGVQECPSFQRQSLLARSRGQSEQLRIAFTGRLVRSQKRAEDVIAIARELSRRDIRYEMVIVGDGDMRTTMEKAAGELMMDRIRFTGAQPNEITLNFIETCDILLLPSSFEGLSISMLEAMSRAVVPVVSSIRSGVPDVIVDGKNGIIVPIADIQAFADRIECLSNNRADLRRIAACAAETINQGYLTEHMINHYIRLLEQVVSTQSERLLGPIVPPSYIAKDLTLSTWMQRIFADPKASLQRVYRRYTNS